MIDLVTAIGGVSLDTSHESETDEQRVTKETNACRAVPR